MAESRFARPAKGAGGMVSSDLVGGLIAFYRVLSPVIAFLKIKKLCNECGN